jgi:hypothetical protein
LNTQQIIIFGTGEIAELADFYFTHDSGLEFCRQGRRQSEIRAAVEYLLRDVAGSVRGDLVREMIEIVRAVANGTPPEQPDPLDDGLPGG